MGVKTHSTEIWLGVNFGCRRHIGFLWPSSCLSSEPCSIFPDSFSSNSKQTGMNTKLKGRCRVAESKFARFADTADSTHNCLQHARSETMAVIPRKNTGGPCELKCRVTSRGDGPVFYTTLTATAASTEVHTFGGSCHAVTGGQVESFQPVGWAERDSPAGSPRRHVSPGSLRLVPAAGCYKGHWTRAKTGRGAPSYEQHGWQSRGRALTALLTCPRRPPQLERDAASRPAALIIPASPRAAVAIIFCWTVVQRAAALKFWPLWPAAEGRRWGKETEAEVTGNIGTFSSVQLCAWGSPRITLRHVCPKNTGFDLQIHVPQADNEKEQEHSRKGKSSLCCERDREHCYWWFVFLFLFLFCFGFFFSRRQVLWL